MASKDIRQRCGMLALALATLISALSSGSTAARAGAEGKPRQFSLGSPSELPMPDAQKLLLMIRLTLTNLADAVRSGNFTVMRDLAAPSFAKRNSASDLGVIFANLSKLGIDLSPAAVFTPQIVSAPKLNQDDKTLLVEVRYAEAPLFVDAKLIYEAVDGRWKLAGLSVVPINLVTAETKPEKPSP